jgi:hypothetical protein
MYLAPETRQRRKPVRICLILWAWAIVWVIEAQGCFDVPIHASPTTHWAVAQVDEALASGLLTGYADGSIRPDQSITRAEFSTLIARGGHAEESVSYAKRLFPRFSDLPSSHWAIGYIELLTEKGYILGTSNTTVSPDRPITRAEAACILDRVLSSLNVPLGSEAPTFVDSAAIPTWARDSVERLAAKKVFIGDEAGRFAPTRNITRAEAVAIVLRSLELVGRRWHLQGTVSQVDVTEREAEIECQNELVTIFYDLNDIFVYRGKEAVGIGSLRQGDKVSVVLKEGGRKAGFILLENDGTFLSP